VQVTELRGRIAREMIHDLVADALAERTSDAHARELPPELLNHASTASIARAKSRPLGLAHAELPPPAARQSVDATPAAGRFGPGAREQPSTPGRQAVVAAAEDRPSSNGGTMTVPASASSL